MNSPIALGYANASLTKLAGRYVYIGDLDAFYDLQSGRVMMSRSVDGLYGHLPLDGRPSEVLRRSKLTARTRCITYVPGEDRLLIPDKDDLLLNVWSPTPLAPNSGTWDLVRELLEFVFPEPDERNHLLRVLACMVQHPNRKIRHMLLITGPQGTGKTTLAEIICALVGRANFRSAEGHALLQRFWSVFVDIQALVIEEVSLSERREISNRLKTLISSDEIPVEEKGLPFRQAKTPKLIVILSNSPTPLALEDSDRRAWVPAYGGQRRDPEFYARLREALPAELPAFMAHLKSMDVRSFNPDAPPPMTESKAQMIDDSRPPLERQLLDMVTNGDPPFTCDLVIPRTVLAYLLGAGFHVSETAVKAALRSLGAASAGQLPKSPQWVGEPRVWAVRNVERWRTASKGEFGEHLSGQHWSSQSVRR